VAYRAKATRTWPGERGERCPLTSGALWCAVIALAALAVDAGTKAWATARLSGGRDIAVGGGLVRLRLVVNHGASFGLGARYEPLIAVVTVIGVILLGTWAARAASTAERAGAAFAAAGAAGNLIDRLTRSPGVLHGGVIDWVHLSFYGPTFNLADVWLRGGVLLAAGGWLWHGRSPAARAAGRTRAGAAGRTRAGAAGRARAGAAGRAGDGEESGQADAGGAADGA
jgi:signal peptidase II